jgi:hypothetical protein
VVWIEEEVQTLAQGQGPGSQEEALELTRLHNPSALRLLSLGYAVGTYGSDEIAQLASSDPVFRLLSENEAPFASELSVARRHHRGALIAILGHVLSRTLALRLNISPEALPETSRQFAKEAAVERIDIARHMDNHE